MIKSYETKEFRNSLFHELRIPISSINGYSSLLLSGELGKLAKPQLKAIQRIRDVSLYASDLINNLLSLSRLETPKVVQYKKISIGELINKSLTTLEPQIRSRKLKISKNLNSIWGIPVDLEQMVINILGNAVKYTPNRGWVYISTSCDSGKLHISIRDTGIGIPKGASDKIFEDFFRAENVAQKYEGSGLGLSIVKKLLEYNKGDISIKSKLNKGTTAEITLPLLSDRDVFDFELEYYISESLRLNVNFSLIMVTERKDTTSKVKKKNNLNNIITQALRENDRAYQIDTGKWIAILPNSAYAEVHLVHEQLRSLLQKRLLSRAKRGKSLSIPIACAAFAIFPTNGASKEELLAYLEKQITEPSAFVTVPGR